MDSILSLQNKIFTWDGKKLMKILGAVASTESCMYKQFDGIWVSMWSFFMESPQFNTSSIRDKLHRWKSLPSSERRIFNNISTTRTRWKVVVYSGILINPQGNEWNVLYSQNIGDRFIKFAGRYQQESFWAKKLIAGGIWKGEILIAYLEDLEKLDASDIYLQTSTMNFEFNSTCFWEKHSLFHLKCIDVASSTHIDLDVLQEKKIGDYWNVDRASICQILGEDLQSSLFWKKKLPRGYAWSGGDWQKFRRLPDQIFVLPEEWTKIGKAIHKREKQDWEKENQKLDNARKLRGLYSIDPDDREYSEILKKHKKKNKKDPWHQPCHAKDGSSQNHESDAEQWQSKGFQNNVGCTVEFSSIHKAASGMFSTHKTWRSHCRKWIFSLTHYHLVRKFIPDATSDEDSGCKSCSGKEMEEDPNDSSLAVGQSQVQKAGYSGSTKRQNKSSLLHWWTCVASKNAELEPKTSEVQRQIRVPLGHCKRRLWSSSSFFTEIVLVCVPDDCRNNHGRYCNITRAGCSQIAQNSQIGISRCLDMSSTT